MSICSQKFRETRRRYGIKTKREKRFMDISAKKRKQDCMVKIAASIVLLIIFLSFAFTLT